MKAQKYKNLEKKTEVYHEITFIHYSDDMYHP